MSLKIHPKLEELLHASALATDNGRVAYYAWNDAGKPICEEATAKPLPATEEEPRRWPDLPFGHTPEEAAQMLAAKDARIAELSREVQRLHEALWLVLGAPRRKP